MTDSSTDLPAHPAMRLAYNCEDVLSLKLSRRLITMVKSREPTGVCVFPP